MGAVSGGRRSCWSWRGGRRHSTYLAEGRNRGKGATDALPQSRPPSAPLDVTTAAPHSPYRHEALRPFPGDRVRATVAGAISLHAPRHAAAEGGTARARWLQPSRRRRDRGGVPADVSLPASLGLRGAAARLAH